MSKDIHTHINYRLAILNLTKPDYQVCVLSYAQDNEGPDPQIKQNLDALHNNATENKLHFTSKIYYLQLSSERVKSCTRPYLGQEVYQKHCCVNSRPQRDAGGKAETRASVEELAVSPNHVCPDKPTQINSFPHFFSTKNSRKPCFAHLVQSSYHIRKLS